MAFFLNNTISLDKVGIREEALSALGELVTPDHLLLLLDALHRNDANMQLNVLILLRKIHDAQSLPYVLPFFESENAQLREAAVTTLRYLNQVERCQEAIALMSDPDENVRRSAVLTLGHLVDAEVVYSREKTTIILQSIIRNVEKFRL
ncbi:MAG: HEAT repeat domain-containing protein [Aphanothece sp. CMT-3BRIN-NPC111]|nr:HEAT repeat domain-containing protein [Aphanothece sp. CMT-3BRIN-NPC111]